MRIAAISDIHANLPALEAVLEDIARLNCDRVIVAGDFINFGPWPIETLKLIRGLGDLVIRGNHEGYVLSQSENQADLIPPYRVLFAPSCWTASLLSPQELAWLAALPEKIQVNGPDDSEILVVHGSPRNQIEGIVPWISEEKLAEIFEGEIMPRRLVISGHTHRPVIRPWQGMLITNCGSVGISIDGDWRASYLLAEWDGEWKAETRRVTYDREKTIKGLERNCSPNEAGPFMRLVKHDIRTGKSWGIGKFNQQYLQLGEYPPPPHDFAHLDEAITQHLSRQAGV